MGEDKIKFQKLTPNDDIDISVYIDAFDYIYENKDIRNVAITGGYSSGKSSVIETYKNVCKNGLNRATKDAMFAKVEKIKDEINEISEQYKCPNRNFIHISLAHFTNDNNAPRSNNDEFHRLSQEAILEGKIINQLIQQIPPENIPMTRFKALKQLKKKSIRKLIIQLLTTALGLLYFFNLAKLMSYRDLIVESNPKFHNLANFLTCPWISLVIAIWITAVIAWLLFELFVSLVANNQIKKINIKGNEVEIFGAQNESYFDKYLNDVIYLFKNAGVRNIVFEDIDRFENCTIFERLREINNLVNVDSEIEKRDEYKSNVTSEDDQPIRFIYLLKDNMFESKDRTKFFDFILSVVPVMDGSNSIDKLSSFLVDSNIYNIFDHYFLDVLCMNIDDIRLLKNIYNEFQIYYYKLIDNIPNPNTMMAIIAYKNVFPEDFAKLQVDKGFVHHVFSNSDKWRNIFVSTINKQIHAQNLVISSGNSNLEKSLESLLTSQQSELNNLHLDFDYESADKDRDLVDVIQKRHEKEIDNLKKEHRKDIFNRTNRVTQLKEDMANLKYKNIKDIMIEEVTTAIFQIHTDSDKAIDDFMEIKMNHHFDLIQTLIVQGYIDETYKDYLTPFYENTLSRQDRLFMSRILGKKGQQFDFEIEKPEKIFLLKKIKIEQLGQIELLNFRLFDCILTNDLVIDGQDVCKLFIKQIRDDSRFEFVEEYYKQTNNVETFVRNMNYHWNDYFSVVINYHTQRDDRPLLSNDEIYRYSIDTLLYSGTEEVLNLVNKNNVLSEYVSNNGAYISEHNKSALIFERDEGEAMNSLIRSMNVIGVKFKRLDVSSICKSLFEAIYRNDLYVLTASNIEIMYLEHYFFKNIPFKSNDEAKKGDSNNADYTVTNKRILRLKRYLKHANYSSLCSRTDEPLLSYVEKNMQIYMEVVLANCDKHITDREDYAIKILNNTGISIDARKLYIEYLQTNIKNITDVTDKGLWKRIIQNEEQIFSEKNCYEYFKSTKMEKLDQPLIDYINNAKKIISFSDVEIPNDERSKSFFRCISECDELDTEKYREALVGINHNYNTFTIPELSGEKVDMLIELDKIRMNAKNIIHIRQHFSDKVFDYIDRNLDEYVTLLDDLTVIHDEIVHVVNGTANDKIKIKAAGYTNDAISIKNSNHSDELMHYLLEHNYDIDDASYIYEFFSGFGENAMTSIERKAADNYDDIIFQEYIVDHELLSILISEYDIDIMSKIELFIQSLPHSNEELCKKHLTELGHEDLCRIFKYKSGSRYDLNEETTAILDGLKNHRWISNFYKNDHGRYVVSK